MQIGNTTIVTPRDNPLQYDPDWRNAVATAATDFPDTAWDPLYRSYRDDIWIKNQVGYLTAARTPRGRITKAMEFNRLASTISQGNRPSDVKFKLEALLLTPIEYRVLAMDLEGGGDEPLSPDFFKTYERLYFNCRRPDGMPFRDCQLRMYFALPDAAEASQNTPIEQVWRTIGATIGYRALVTMWMWSDAHGLAKQSRKFVVEDTWRVAQMVMLSRIAKQQISNFDLINAIKAMADIYQMEHNLGTTDSGDGGQTNTMLAILKQFVPQIVAGSVEVDKLNDQTTAIAQRMAAQRNVQGQDINDLGKEVGEKFFNQRMQNEFKTKQE